MPVDLSNATLSEFQEQGTAPRAEFVALGDQTPDITKHDPNTFAALTGQNALKTLYAQGLIPTADDIKGIFNKALDSANEYHKTIAQQQEQANLELQKRLAAVKSGTLAAEKSTEAGVELQKEQALQQWQQTGEIHRASDADVKRINGFEQGYTTADKLQQYHKDMAATTPGAAGWLKSNILGFVTQPNITSQETKDFNAYLESSIVPLGRGVFGDAATAATKESIQANMREMLANKDDNPLSAGHKTYMLKDRIMQNLITDRNNAEANHVDTTPWDKAIGRLSGNFTSQDTRQFAPKWANGGDGSPLVNVGTSNQANATTASVNAGANAGVQVQPAAAPGHQSGSTLNPQPAQEAQQQPQAAPTLSPLPENWDPSASQPRSSQGKTGGW